MHMVSHIYTVILEPQPEGGFIVTVPALPEVQSAGDSEAEALARTHDAIAAVLMFGAIMTWQSQPTSFLCFGLSW